MRKNFIMSSLKLVTLGIVLGLLARFILGDPVSPDEMDRQFNSPLDSSSIEPEEFELPDYKILD